MLFEWLFLECSLPIAEARVRFLAGTSCLEVSHRGGRVLTGKPFLRSSELGLPQPVTRRRVCPPLPGSGGRGTLAGERGVGRVPIPTRGHTCGTLYIYVLCGVFSYSTKLSCGRRHPQQAGLKTPSSINFKICKKVIISSLRLLSSLRNFSNNSMEKP
jgi:hypothetical protein